MSAPALSPEEERAGRREIPSSPLLIHRQGFEGVAGATNKELRDSDGREMVSAPGTNADLMGGKAKGRCPDG